MDESLFYDEERFYLHDPALSRAPLGGAWLHLYDESGKKRATLDNLEVPELPGLPWGVDWLVPGWPARCLTPLPVGNGTLRAENERGVIFEREITIEQGRTTVVRW